MKIRNWTDNTFLKEPHSLKLSLGIPWISKQNINRFHTSQLPVGMCKTLQGCETRVSQQCSRRNDFHMDQLIPFSMAQR